MNADELEQLRQIFFAEAKALDRALELVRVLHASLANLAMHEPDR